MMEERLEREIRDFLHPSRSPLWRWLVAQLDANLLDLCLKSPPKELQHQILALVKQRVDTIAEEQPDSWHKAIATDPCSGKMLLSDINN